MKKIPIVDPATHTVLPGAAFDSPGHGRLAVHPCANECAGIIIGQASKTGTSVLHFTPSEALEIGQTIVDLARKALG